MGGLSRVRTRAPELSGRGWLNGGPLTLAGLRGRVVLLDFFTGGCVNCRHVLREVSALEDRFGDALRVVGVHSPKFPYEAEPAAVRSAVERLGIRHPVLDDGDHRTLEQYAVRAWPTLVLVGPDGRVEAVAAGEGHGPALARLVEDLLGRQREVPPASPAGQRAAGDVLVRHPQGLVRLPDGDLLVADAGHGSVTRLDPAGTRLRRRYGGIAGPGGLAVLPRPVAAVVGYDVVVADTDGHALLGLDLDDGSWRRLAGTGHRRPPATGPPQGPAAAEALASPEDVVWWRAADGLVVAMAGLHQLWLYDPRDRALTVLAGTGGEQLRDGPAPRALLAQPTALAVHPDGALWWVDAESSAVRRLAGAGGAAGAVGGVVTTAVGTGLFAHGHVDGPLADALLQHPQGIVVLPDGALLVCDTYNGALRRLDPVRGRVATVALGLREPVAAVPAADGGWLVAESAASRLTHVELSQPSELSGRSELSGP